MLTCCTQYVSIFGKLSSGHRTGKGQFSSQSQRRAMSKNAQTTTQLCSLQMLAIQSQHSMANRWKKSENSDRFYFPGLQNHCILWLQSRSRDITLPTKVCIVQFMVFLIVMCRRESWLNVKELMLVNCGTVEDSRVPCTARRSKPVNPKGN